MSTPLEGPPFEQPESFEFTPENLERAKAHIAKYPPGRQASAVLPLLWIAQEQHGGWLPRAAMDHVAGILEMAPIRVYEVATFYTMFNLRPVGRYLLQACTTTPCWLRGSDDGGRACERKLGIGDRRHHAGRALHPGRGRVSRRLRQRPDPAGQRRFLRGSGRAGDRGAARRAARRQGAAAGFGDRRQGSEPVTGRTTLTNLSRSLPAAKDEKPSSFEPALLSHRE